MKNSKSIRYWAMGLVGWAGLIGCVTPPEQGEGPSRAGGSPGAVSAGGNGSGDSSSGGAVDPQRSGGASSSTGGGAAGGDTASGGAFGPTATWLRQVETDEKVCFLVSDPEADRFEEVCLPWIECAAGSFPTLTLTPRAMLTCEACGEGTFSESPGARRCSPCLTCGSLGIDEQCRADQNTRCNHSGKVFQFGTTDNDWLEDAVADADGNIWVTGNISVAETGETRASYARKVATAGSEDFFEEFVSGDARARGVAIDETGQSWAVGFSDMGLPGKVLGTYDTFLRRYPAGGSLPSTLQLGSEGDDNAEAIVSGGPGGGIWVAGETNDSLFAQSLGSYDLFLAHYSSDGELLESKQFGGPGSDYLGGMATDSEHNVWIGASIFSTDVEAENGHFIATLYKLSAEDGSLTEIPLDLDPNAHIADVAVDSNGRIWVTGTTPEVYGGTNVTPNDVFVRSYTEAGGEALFDDTFGSGDSDFATSITVDVAGNVWVLGGSSCNLGDDDIENPVELASDWQGNTIDMVELCSPWQPGMGGGDIFVKIYPHDGSSPRTYQIGTSGSESPAQLVSTGEGVWVSGTTSEWLAGPPPVGVSGFLWQFFL